MGAHGPAASSGARPGSLAQLTRLGELGAAGILTEQEFRTQEARILNG